MIGCSESINNFPDQLLLSQFCTFLSPIGISCISYNTPSRDLAGIHAQGRSACIPAQIPTMGYYNLFIACSPGVIITDSPAVHIYIWPTVYVSDTCTAAQYSGVL